MIVVLPTPDDPSRQQVRPGSSKVPSSSNPLPSTLLRAMMAALVTALMAARFCSISCGLTRSVLVRRMTGFT